MKDFFTIKFAYRGSGSDFVGIPIRDKLDFPYTELALEYYSFLDG
ncbi:hypothetical protein [Leptospira santarosai]|nr:hypothetical protein [Leptospira santarosai]